MDIVPFAAGFGGELRGVTLADVASDDTAYAAVRAAFEEHSVLVFRDQQVTDELQLSFSRRFGPPEVTKVGSQGTGSHFVILSNGGCDRTRHELPAPMAQGRRRDVGQPGDHASGRPWPAHEARLMVRTTVCATKADGVDTMRPPSSQAAAETNPLGPAQRTRKAT